MSEADRVVSGGANLRGYAPSVFVTMFDYDFAVSGEPAAGLAISTHAIPAGARIIGGWYEVLTTFTTAGADGGTLTLYAVNANDLVTAIAVSDGTNPWDVDLTKRRPLKGIATTLTARKYVTIKSATQLVEAGKLVGAVEWILPEKMSTGH